MGFAKLSVIGHLGKDPELKYTPNGKAVCEFSVAVNQGRRDPQTGDWSDETDWFRVSVWGDRGERAAEELRKGSRVFVGGRFRTRAYETNDGRKGMSLELSADDLVSLDKKDVEAATDTRGGTDWGTKPAQAKTPAEPDFDDLPF